MPEADDADPHTLQARTVVGSGGGANDSGGGGGSRGTKELTSIQAGIGHVQEGSIAGGNVFSSCMFCVPKSTIY